MTALPTSNPIESIATSCTPAPRGSLLLAPCWFLPLHRWFLGMALLDAMLTSMVLARGGEELNAVARTVIESSGLTGMVLYKLALVVVILVLVELIGRHRQEAARAVALVAIGANSAAAAIGAAYLALFASAAYL